MFKKIIFKILTNHYFFFLSFIKKYSFLFLFYEVKIEIMRQFEVEICEMKA